MSLLASTAMQKQFMLFCEWLPGVSTTKNAAIKLKTHVNLFAQIEAQWGEIPSYETLLDHFGAEGLRRYRHPMQWFSESALVTVDKKIANAHSEKTQIDALLRKIPDQTIAHEIAVRYTETLFDQHQQDKLTIRSVRLALTPAIKLLLHEPNNPPKQAGLHHLLKNSPGQLAAITRFIHYINQHWQCQIILPKNCDHHSSSAR